jgi:GTP-binding protein YchF
LGGIVGGNPAIGGGRSQSTRRSPAVKHPLAFHFFLATPPAYLHVAPAMLKAGIVGLPNVGKSTLFNALTRTRKAEAANYPFCTIDPNVGIVSVPDPRLPLLAKITGSRRILPTAIEFVDIAGLVKGASEGAGLGNQFLANIRETDAIVQVVRCFENNDIIHELGTVDPVRDIEIINAELILADLAALERRRASREKKARGGDQEAKREVDLIDILQPHLDQGKPAITLDFCEEDKLVVRDFFLLSNKRTIYACNVAEHELAAAISAPDNHPQVAKVRHYAAEHSGSEAVVISARIEEELSDLPPEEAAEFLHDMGVADSGVSALIGAVYHLLGLRTYLTTGPQESRAWTIIAGTKAPAAAGVIHSDFERGFIAAEVVAFADLAAAGSKTAAKAAAKVRIEGKEYVVRDGDVIDFRFNV